LLQALCRKEEGILRTALSFRPNNKTSSINVNLGILLLSASSWKSLGSYAIFWPLPSTDEPEGTTPLLSLDALGAEDEDGLEEEGNWSEDPVVGEPAFPALLRVRPSPIATGMCDGVG
jgi:hypothetical protein